MVHIKKFLFFILIIFAAAAIALIINAIYCNNTLEVINYSINTEKLSTSLRIVAVSDQHNKEFGENNSSLVEKIKEQNPDLIAVCGDMVTRGNTDDSVMKTFLSQVSQIAPTYCVLGNHELSMADEVDFVTEYNSTGAKLLDNELVEITKDDESILICGISDYPFYEYNAPDYDVPEKHCWDELIEKSENKFSILLHHQPEYIGTNAEGSGIDLILCGHTHGGLVRLPFVGGLIAPNQGLFPKYDKGEFEFGSTKMIITSGLSNSNLVPRINNCAEITVIDVN